MSIRPVNRIVAVRSRPSRARASSLRRAFGFGDTDEFDPFLLLRRLPQRRPGRLPRRLPVASAPRHRDDHLRARRHGRARRQPRQPRRARRRRRAVDDRRAAASSTRRCRRATPHGPHARLPALGEPARASLKMTAPRYQDVKRARHPRGHRRRRHARARRLRRVLGQARAGRRASPPTRATSTSRCRRAGASACRSRPRATRSPTCSPASGTFRDASRAAARCPPSTSAAGRADRAASEAGNRSLVLFDRGDEVVVAGGRARASASCSFGQAARGAGRLVRPDRDEHRGGTAQAFAELRAGTFLDPR